MIGPDFGCQSRESKNGRFYSPGSESLSPEPVAVSSQAGVRELLGVDVQTGGLQKLANGFNRIKVDVPDVVGHKIKAQPAIIFEGHFHEDEPGNTGRLEQQLPRIFD